MKNQGLSPADSQHILLTGVTGFVGQAVAEHILSKTHFALTVSVRATYASISNAMRVVRVGGLSMKTDWEQALRGVDTVVHLAARAHVLRETSLDPMKEFRHVNVDGTVELARQALKSGVKRFVFVSSVGVNGTITTNQPLTELSETLPEAYYAVSKFEAEQGLWELCRDSDMELVIIRPPLVYAGHAPGNFARLLKLVACGIPLPFASVLNQRSMIALDNLVDFITLCVNHPSAGNHLFLVSDGEDVSTPSMLRLLATGMGKQARLVPFPVSIMKWGAQTLRREAMFNQLCGSLVIDSSKARKLLNWTPPVSLEYGLRKAARDYLNLRG